MILEKPDMRLKLSPVQVVPTVVQDEIQWNQSVQTSRDPVANG